MRRLVTTIQNQISFKHSFLWHAGLMLAFLLGLMGVLSEQLSKFFRYFLEHFSTALAGVRSVSAVLPRVNHENLRGA
jgi:hypothetical protein